MQNQRIMLLHLLSQAETPLNSSQCAQRIGISTRKLKSEIKTLNLELKDYGAVIEGKTGNGNGYILQIQDESKFCYFMNTILPEQSKKEKESFNHQAVRVQYLLKKILQQYDYVKTDDLCEEMNISRGQLQNDLKQVKAYLKEYHIKFENRPHYGFQVAGSEQSIRMALANLVNSKETTTSAAIDMELQNIREIILQESKKFGYQLSDLTCQNLTSHLYIAMRRYEKKYKIVFPAHECESIKQEKEYALAEAIVQSITLRFHIELPIEGIYYCTIHLCGKKIVQEYVLNDEILHCIEQMLVKIKDEYNIDFMNNLNLKVALGLHMIPLLSRIQYHLEMKNPLLSEIKANYILAYEIASCGTAIINEIYHCILSDNEIGYLALHFELALNEQLQERKKNVIIVCSTGRGTSQLLSSRFLRRYGEYINSIVTCNAFELIQYDLSNIDYVFTTVPISYQIAKPMIQISHLMNECDYEVIEKTLVDSKQYLEFIKYFKHDLFMGEIDVTSKEELLTIMNEKIQGVYPMPADVLDSIWKREKLASTNFAPKVAIPHPIRIICEHTLICVAVTKNPIVWGNQEKVQVVFLCLFEKGFAKKNKDFFHLLSQLITNRKSINQFIANPTYEVFTNIIKENMER